MTATDELAQNTVTHWEEELRHRVKDRATALVVLWRETEGGPAMFLPTECAPMGRAVVLARCGIDVDDTHALPWAAAYVDIITGEHHAFGNDESLKQSALRWLRSNLNNLPTGTYEL